MPRRNVTDDEEGDRDDELGENVPAKRGASKTKSTSSSSGSVPVATITRLALYLRELQQLQRQGQAQIQSSVLARRLGLNDAQVRRDLSHFGQFGQRGVGYNIAALCDAIRGILGTDRSWNVLLIGIGNLGRALTGYRGFNQQGFHLVAAVDSDPDKIGKKIGPLTIGALDDLETIIARDKIDLAILAVPAQFANDVVERLEAAGVQGVLNFAPVAVRKPKSKLTVVDVDLAVELQRLAYAVLESDPRD